MMKIKWHDDTKEKMKVNEKNGVVYLTYPAWDHLSGYLHGFSTRLGGVSEEHLSSMNLSFSRGDTREHVMENFRRIGNAMGFSPEQVVLSYQTHTTNVRVVGKGDAGSGIVKPRSYQDVDGLITDVPGIILTTSYADCVPLFFIDPVHHSVGLSHSGWRGTVGKIGRETLRKMKEAFGTNPFDVYAAIGPSICQNCYEVSEDVISEFRSRFPESCWELLYEEKGNGKYQLNLWEANHRILLEAGVQEERISFPNLCTCCNPEFLFSHRASKGLRGNLAAFLGIQ